MNSPTNLDTLLKEILITPLVGAMMERGIKPSGERFVRELEKCPMPGTAEAEAEEA